MFYGTKIMYLNKKNDPQSESFFGFERLVINVCYLMTNRLKVSLLPVCIFKI